MEWTIFAILQMFVITLAVSLAFWLRFRQISKQNAELRSHITLLQDNRNPANAPDNANPADPDTWVAEKVAGLAEHPCAPLLQLVLNHQINPQDNFDQALADAARACGLSTEAGAVEGDPDEKVAELEQTVETLRAELETLQAGGPDNEDSEELKALLQQYTKDSREMMFCIQTLEKENAALKEQMEDSANAEETPAETHADAATTDTAPAEPSADPADDNDHALDPPPTMENAQESAA